MTDLAGAALSYATRLGWPVLPCWWIAGDRCACGAESGDCKPGKHPIGLAVRHGLKDATLDQAVIERWWRRWPSANIAITTGERAGLFILDIDGREGELALVDLERRHGAMPDLYPMQWTGGGRGGWQAFLAWPEDREIRNSAGRLGPKLDTRGNGGYVVVPPSVTVEAYRWADDRSPWHLPPEPAPDWLIELLDPPAAPEPEREAFSAMPHRARAGEDRYALKAFETELKLTARAPEGERNEQLFSSTFTLLRLVERGQLPKGTVLDGLRAAARSAGLSDIEIDRTIGSAARRRGIAA